MAVWPFLLFYTSQLWALHVVIKSQFFHTFIIIIRPHRRNTYVDAAIVTDRAAWSVGLSFCRSVCHSSQLCKTAEPIEMPFGMTTRMGPRKHVLDGGPDIPWKGAILIGQRAVHCIGTLYHLPYVSCACGPKEACVTWGHIGATWRI